MAKILVSSCLLGCNCRYDGKNCYNQAVIDLAKNHTLIPICPEQMGGLTTPRDPSEIKDDKVFNNKGRDVTNEYTNGALMALKLAKINDCKYALLKIKSPACGSGLIYDGTFSGNKIKGDGVCAKLLKANDIQVFNEEEIADLINVLK